VYLTVIVVSSNIHNGLGKHVDPHTHTHTNIKSRPRWHYVDWCVPHPPLIDYPVMAEMLTYLKSKGMVYVLDNDNFIDIFPDEKFAREVMQLFSVGLLRLDIDGTPVIDTDGITPLQTYTNDDIMYGTHAWT
jgi:hypothetical protein